jgi:GTP-binding protein
LLNKILGYERSIVTDVPGTTRDSIEESMTFENKKLVFVDTAGIRRKSKVETKGIEYASVQRSIDSIKKSEVVLLLIDSIENISQQDKKIASMLHTNYSH